MTAAPVPLGRAVVARLAARLVGTALAAFSTLTSGASAAFAQASPAAPAAPRAVAAADRPNFIFIVTDDQRFDAMGVVQREQGEAGRFPWIKTPNMDRLAREGVRFRNAFVTNSLCSPSRACFLTGNYNHVNGVVNNRGRYDTDNVSHAHVLREAGYTTGYFGKWHMGQDTARPGFDRSASFLGQGKYVDCDIQVDGQITPSKGWVDDVSTDYAIEFIKQTNGRPFDMVLAFKAPHGGWVPPERSKSLYVDDRPRDVPNTVSFPPFGDVAALNNLHSDPASQPAGHNTGPYTLDKVRNYFRCVTAADDNIGRVLDTLDDLKLADNTVVVFASDNGFYLGEHHLGDKRSGYEESIRIPLIVRYPRMVAAGQVRDQMVLNIDLAPTIVDLAGAKAPKPMHGRSWRPLLASSDTPVPWRTSFFYTYFLENPFAMPTVIGVRTETAKLMTYPENEAWTELFDLRADPFETRNLAADPAHKPLLDQLRAELAGQMRDLQFAIPPNADKKRQAPPATRPTTRAVAPTE